MAQKVAANSSAAILTLAGKVRPLPLELCDVDPDFRRRFDYEIDALAESIHENGQIHPGVAVEQPDGRFQVVVGIRRLLACKKSFELNGTPTEFLATVPDEAPNEKARHILALAENEREKGQRQDLTLEEQVAYFGSLARKFSEEEVVDIGTKAGKSAEAVRRLLKLSQTLDDAKVHDAYEIEKAADFRFSLAHLEELSKVEEPRAFVQAAATTAVIKADPAEIERDVLPVAGETCSGIAWFSSKFPEYAGEKKEEEDTDSDEEENDDVASSVIPTCYFVVCPRPKCRAGAPVEFKVKAEVTHHYLWGEKGPEKITISPDTEQSGWLTCRWCGQEFFVGIWKETKDGTVHIRASIKEATERAATKATLAEPCTVKRGAGEEWMLVMGGRKYLYGKDGKLREIEGADGRKKRDGQRSK